MKIGYARAGRTDRVAGLEAQERDLKAVGIERLFKEQTSPVEHRQALEDAIDFARKGDVLVVTKLDRLERSVGHLAQLVERLERKRVSLRILSIGVDTATPTGCSMINLLGSIARIERDTVLERRRDGITKAKVEGKCKGRAPTARARAAEVIELAGRPNMTKEAIAASLNLGVASVYRILKECRTA